MKKNKNKNKKPKKKDIVKGRETMSEVKKLTPAADPLAACYARMLRKPPSHLGFYKSSLYHSLCLTGNRTHDRTYDSTSLQPTTRPLYPGGDNPLNQAGSYIRKSRDWETLIGKGTRNRKNRQQLLWKAAHTHHTAAHEVPPSAAWLNPGR
jgi:hypothetical protein